MAASKKTMTEIVRMCLKIDMMAVKVYLKFLEAPLPAPVRKLFRTLHEDETRHVAYWSGLLERARRGEVLELFEDPDQVYHELVTVAETALAFQKGIVRHPPRDATALILAAIRMEYVLLHPSFLVLFDFADILPGRRTMEDEYAMHMDHLCGALNTQGAENPMFPLFGELLRRVWAETKRLVRLNQSDPLSGALNRRGFWTQLQPLLSLALRKHFPVAVMVIDVDRFKRINDEYGHQAGDKVIRLVSEAVTREVRQSDLVARYGGDEFTVFFMDTRPEAIAATAKKIRERVREKTARIEAVTVSIGAACLMLKGSTDRALERLIREADEALYEVKRAGRDNFRLRELE
jgi:diguanylate cyclase (GGDEF)-like protein